MAAEKIKKQPMTKPRRQMPKPGSKTQAILTLTTTTPATPVEIAESVNCSRAAVTQTLQRYGIKPNRLDSYKKHRADVFAGLQLKVIKHLNDEETLKSASTNNLAYTLTQLNQMERLERNQSTANISTAHGITPEMQELYDKITGRVKVESSANQGIELNTQAIDITSVDDNV